MSPEAKASILQTNPGNEIVEIDSDAFLRFLTDVFEIDTHHFDLEDVSFAKFKVDLRGSSGSVFIEVPREDGVTVKFELYRAAAIWQDKPKEGTYLDIKAESKKEDENSISTSNQIVKGTYPSPITKMLTESEGRHGKAIYLKSETGGVVLTHGGNIIFHPGIL